jgi:beta-galactosidase/beta-glucuronidase
LYHADKLGYICWGEFPDWGCNAEGPPGNNQQPTATYITQWCEAIERDYSHPCIVGWCPLNETWQRLTDKITVLDDVTRGMFLATKAMDTTRPVLDTSGYAHRVFETDIYDSHDYERPAVFRQRVRRHLVEPRCQAG